MSAKSIFTKIFQETKPLDYLIFVLILFCAIYVMHDSWRASGDKITVHAGDDIYEFSLREDGVHRVKGHLGETVIEIKGGRAHIIGSPCKNKTCIRQGFGKTLVCLPNKVMVHVEDSEGYDAVSQ
jgi:hypothetical protein